jgi:uncharacterized protein (TIGR03435 family)
MGRLALLSTVAVVLCSSAGAQEPPGPSFAVASVRVNTTGTALSTAENVPRIAIQPGGRFTARNSSLEEMIAVAYGVRSYQIVGPRWIDSERFDIEARADGDLTLDLTREMLRTLLRARFRLAAHGESRNLPVYALLTRSGGKPGSDLRASGDTCAPPSPPRNLPPVPPPPPPPPGQQMTLLNNPWPRTCPSIFAPGFLSIRKMGMDEFAARITQFVDRPVLNRTALAGFFDFELLFTPDVVAGPAPPVVDPTAPSLFTAVQEQLGLRLDAQRAPVDVLVIDAVERPTEN